MSKGAEGDEKLAILMKAETHYSEMSSLVSRNATNDAQDMQEDFFVIANEERIVLKLEIDKLNVANLSPE